MTLASRHPQISECHEERWQTPALQLDHFQQMMLEWDKIHPYNAVHTVRLAGRADALALQEAVHLACATAGIGELMVNHESRTYRYESVESIQIRQLPAGGVTEPTLLAVISEEMNKPFPAGPHFPLRWTVFDHPATDAHFVVLAYHHVVADAYSIQSLLALVMHQYLKLPAGDDHACLPTSTSTYGTPLGRGSRRSYHARSLLRMIRQYFKLRSAHRMHDDRSGRGETKFLLRSIPDGTLNHLRDVCRAEGAGLNDAFLAALATAVALATPGRRTHRRRRKIAVGTVLSHRKQAAEGLSEFFGVCLSDAVLLVDKPDAGMRGVLAQIVPQTRRLKAPQGTGEPSWRFLFVKYLWPALRIPHNEASYRKVFPLCAGVSTVSVDEARFGETMGHVQRYIRACPPGPAMPMLLAPTIGAGRLELGLIFRLAYFTEAQAQGLLDTLVDVLDQFAG